MKAKSQTFEPKKSLTIEFVDDLKKGTTKNAFKSALSLAKYMGKHYEGYCGIFPHQMVNSTSEMRQSSGFGRSLYVHKDLKEEFPDLSEQEAVKQYADFLLIMTQIYAEAYVGAKAYCEALEEKNTNNKRKS